jgi:hypothetical protein
VLREQQDQQEHRGMLVLWGQQELKEPQVLKALKEPIRVHKVLQELKEP